MRRSSLVICLGAVLFLGGSAGCASRSASATKPAASRSGRAPPTLSKECGSAHADAGSRSLWFRAADHVRLHGVMLGGGGAGVVLAHQYPADLCGWATYARTLARSGFRVLLFDFRGFGASDHPSPQMIGHAERDVIAAAALLRQRGAQTVSLCGASFGAAAVLVAAPAIRPAPAAVVSLSAETDLGFLGPNYSLHPLRAVPRLRSPLLLMVARGDRYVSLGDARALLRAAGAKPKRLVVFDAGHGLELLKPPNGPRATRLLLAFLRGHAPAG
jgi:pimeloyl-ACP methyl ester carboxylesterase